MNIFYKTLIAIVIVSSPLVSAINLGIDKKSHEMFIAAQEIITLGCLGKLEVSLNSSGEYNAVTMSKIQSCADNASTDIAADILSDYEQGEIAKERIPNFFLSYAVIFAKKYSSQARSIKTEDLIYEATKQGRKHYPYPEN